MAKRKAPRLFEDEAKRPVPVQRVIDRFHDKFLARFGFKPDPRGFGRFAKDVTTLISAWGEDEVVGLIDDFFATRDPRIVRSDYTQAAFLNLAQYLRVRHGNVRDERTAANVDAAARATGRR